MKIYICCNLWLSKFTLLEGEAYPQVKDHCFKRRSRTIHEWRHVLWEWLLMWRRRGVKLLSQVNGSSIRDICRFLTPPTLATNGGRRVSRQQYSHILDRSDSAPQNRALLKWGVRTAVEWTENYKNVPTYAIVNISPRSLAKQTRKVKCRLL